MHGNRILLTGGLGQVGSYICEELVSQGREVTILDNASSNVNSPPSEVHCIKGDICDEKLVKGLVKDTDVVIHCAAQVFVSHSVVDPLFDADNNIFGTLKLLDALRNVNIKRFIYFSSAAVYGNPVRLPVDEAHPQDPVSPYGVSKLCGEKYALAFNKIYGLPTTAIRPFNIYSPRQDSSNPYSGVISKFIDNIANHKSPVIFGDGSATRDFVSVQDVVGMVMLLLEKKEAVGKVFNCGCGVNTRIDELAQTIINLYDCDLKPEFRPERPGDIKYSYADISLAKNVLDYAPKVPLTEGLKIMIEHKSRNYSESCQI